VSFQEQCTNSQHYLPLVAPQPVAIARVPSYVMELTLGKQIGLMLGYLEKSTVLILSIEKSLSKFAPEIHNR